MVTSLPTSVTFLTLPLLPLSQSRSDDAVPIRWQCPTAVTTRVYTAKSDVYSFGALLCGGATPFAELAAGEVVRAVQAGARLSRPSASTPEDIMMLIRACTALEARPNVASVCARLNGAWTLEVAIERDSAAEAVEAEDEDTETSL